MSRVARDIAAMRDHSLETTGIQYFPEEENIRSGVALIVGPPDTPYENGIYFIKCAFPQEYPFKPPVCTHLSHCSLRQSPNFHGDGKVCLSRLNTWGSDPKLQWTPIMSLEYVLKMIQHQVLTSTPLDNEPDYNYSKIDKENSDNYSQIVEFANYKYNVCELIGMLPRGVPDTIASAIHDVVLNFIRKRIPTYTTKFRALGVHDGKYVNCTTYVDCHTYLSYYRLQNILADTNLS